MKIGTSNAQFKSRGVLNSFEFEVETNAKMMTMLSDGTYSDKIMAPIRELCSNALDAHIAVNKKFIPFEVHLPTYDEPTFEIRDYGIGLTQEQMEKLYRTYGASDKTESNAYTGYMGIGSKSPFAYCRNFAATSFKDGKKYVYHVGKNDKDIPVLNHMLTEETTEENGMHISFAVESSDYTTFSNKIKEMTRVLPVCPTVNIDSFKPHIEERGELFSGDGWVLYEYDGIDKAHCVMGHVRYPINSSHFTNNPEETSKRTWGGRYSSENNIYTQLLDVSLELEMDMGEVEPQISRESLQYNKHTIDNIKRKIDLIIPEIKIDIEKKFKECKTLWEARCLYKELSSSYLSCITEILKKVTWKGTEVYTEAASFDKEDLIVMRFGEGYKTGISREEDISYISQHDIRENTGFFINDVKTGAYACSGRIIRGEYEEKDYEGDFNTIILIKEYTEKSLKLFIKQIGLDKSQVNKISDLPKLTPKARNKSVVKSYILKHTTQYSYLSCNKWAEEEINFEDGGVYVEFNNYKIVNKNGYREDTHNIQEIIRYAESLGINVPIVYGVKTAQLKKVKGDGWKTVQEYITDELKKYCQKQNISDKIQKHNEWKQLKAIVKEYVKFATYNIKDKNNPIYIMCKSLKGLQSAYDLSYGDLSDVKNLASKIDYKLDTETKSEGKIDKLMKEIDKQYPLMSIFAKSDVYLYDEDKTLIEDYINSKENVLLTN